MARVPLSMNTASNQAGKWANSMAGLFQVQHRAEGQKGQQRGQGEGRAEGCRHEGVRRGAQGRKVGQDHHRHGGGPGSGVDVEKHGLVKKGLEQGVDQCAENEVTAHSEEFGRGVPAVFVPRRGPSQAFCCADMRLEVNF